MKIKLAFFPDDQILILLFFIHIYIFISNALLNELNYVYGKSFTPLHIVQWAVHGMNGSVFIVLRMHSTFASGMSGVN